MGKHSAFSCGQKTRTKDLLYKRLIFHKFSSIAFFLAWIKTTASFQHEHTLIDLIHYNNIRCEDWWHTHAQAHTHRLCVCVRVWVCVCLCVSMWLWVCVCVCVCTWQALICIVISMAMVAGQSSLPVDIRSESLFHRKQAHLRESRGTPITTACLCLCVCVWEPALVCNILSHTHADSHQH